MGTGEGDRLHADGLSVLDGYRIIVFEERELIAASLVAVLTKAPQIASVRATADAEQVVRIARDADVLVLGMVRGRPWAALELLQRLRRLAMPIRILLLSDDDDLEVIVQGLELGADGACLSRMGEAMLHRAVLTVATGQVALPDEYVSDILRDLRHSTERDQDRAKTLERLTFRERQILRMLSDGRGGSEIAQELGLSLSTVRSHLQHILHKLGVHSQLHAAALGRQLFAEQSPTPSSDTHASRLD
jgi:DNA-binding NarL/FixJ family response regulator